MIKYVYILITLCFCIPVNAQNNQQVKQLLDKYDSLYALHEYKEACVVLEDIMDIEREQHQAKMQKVSDRLTRELHNDDLARQHAAKEKELRDQHDRQTESERLSIQLKGEEAIVEQQANQARLEHERISYENARKNDELNQLREQLEANKSYKQAEYNRFISNVSWIIAGVVSILIIIALVWAYRMRKTRNRLKHIVSQLQEMRNDATAANRMKNIFVQNMSHDIRTPLNAVMGFTQLLAVPELLLTSEEKQEYESYILNNANLLTMLIDDILNISDVESGNYNIKMGMHPINSIGQRALSCISYRINEEVKLSFTSDVPDDYKISCDSRRVQQILINYLTNAAKNTMEGEISVHISVDEVPGMVTFSVTDTGKGVPPELGEQIFERFAKLDNLKQGSGLGLNICRVLSERMGGRVYLDTSYTDGARFKLDIPKGDA